MKGSRGSIRLIVAMVAALALNICLAGVALAAGVPPVGPGHLPPPGKAQGVGGVWLPGILLLAAVLVSGPIFWRASLPRGRHVGATAAATAQR